MVPTSRSVRLTALLSCVEHIDELDAVTVQAVLEEYGLNPPSDIDGVIPRKRLFEVLRAADDDTLVELAAFLAEPRATLLDESMPFQTQGLRLFFSHLSRSHQFAQDVGDILESLGFEVLIAHQDIKPSKDWQSTLSAGLDQCDGLVAFVENGFRSSEWCDQEVGWALGRHRPVLCLFREGEAPYGLAGRFQGQSFEDKEADRVARDIVAWSIDREELVHRVAESLTSMLENSTSFAQTRSLTEFLRQIPPESMPAAAIRRLRDACKLNSQVGRAVVPRRAGKPYPTQGFEEWLVATYGAAEGASA